MDFLDSSCDSIRTYIKTEDLSLLFIVERTTMQIQTSQITANLCVLPTPAASNFTRETVNISPLFCLQQLLPHLQGGVSTSRSKEEKFLADRDV